ncbi:MAG: hypothetical protein F2837_09110 [Actinobacteria bacterium]|uniref:Unannotated protein n=1 Tax=freshwater metagenome TaxID=449393 RepID=A0A6J7K2H0_9ZZZZ|nr:hypothetical protein [Actinomycetota bacterium]
MNPRRPLRGLVAAILAISVVAVGLAGVSTASAAVNPYVQYQVSVHGNPTAVAITPNSATIVVVTSTERLSFIDPVLRYVTNSDMTCDSPNDVAVSPDGTSVYVACATEVWEHNFADPEVTDSFSLPGGVAPQHIAITPDGSRAYIADGATAQLIAVDLDTRETITTIPLLNGISPSDLAISPNGTRAITVTSEGNIDLFDIDPNSADYNTRIRNDTSSSGMHGVVFSPDSTRAYIGLDDSGNRQVEICEVGTYCGFNSSIDPVGSPLAIAISPDGNTLYTANYQGTVSLLNVVTENPIDNYDLRNDNDPVTAIAAAANDKYIVAAQYNDGITIVGTTVASKPGRLTALRAVRGDGSASISFTAGSDGGSPITKYQYMVDNGSWTDAVETSSPITVTGLSNYTNHRISLRAVNAVGASRMSAALKVRPRFTGPVLDTATANGFASITANFSSVLFGGVNGFRYSVEVKEVGTTSLFGFCRVGVSVRSCSVIGLNPDTEYNVTVTHFFRFPSSEDRRKTLPSNAVTVRTNPNP